MPFVRISLPNNVTAEQAQHVSDATHRALVATFQVPQADRFQVLTRHGTGELICSSEYLGIQHGPAVALIQITCSEGRSVEMKKDLFATLASAIAEGGAIRAADVIVSLVEVKKENWSFGNGLAQYAL
jgi:phenylpyruvate tautomerase PptA (4-oxalocrotonate tautomerase family)